MTYDLGSFQPRRKPCGKKLPHRHSAASSRALSQASKARLTGRPQ